MKATDTWLAVLAILVCGTALATPPPVKPSAVPPPNPETLIPPPAYALDSGVTENADSLFRQNEGIQTPGMNLYRASAGDRSPTSFSTLRIGTRRLSDRGDMPASEAYVVGDNQL